MKPNGNFGIFGFEIVVIFLLAKGGLVTLCLLFDFFAALCDVIYVGSL